MITLTAQASGTIPIEAECIRPDTFAGKKLAEIAALPVLFGNSPAPLGDFFHIQGQSDDGAIRIEGDCSHVKWIGARMTEGRITLAGSAGMHLGAWMSGGTIEVQGGTGDWAGAEMRGGHISIHGDAGNLLGAGYRGSRSGMRGGVILVHGKAGNEIGAVMRRGFIAVGGGCGAFAGISLLAGTLFVFGPCGGRPGAGMKRGTIALFDSAPALLPSFRYTCSLHPVFLSLYLTLLSRWGFPLPDVPHSGRWRRYAGDLVALGKGEILMGEER